LLWAQFNVISHVKIGSDKVMFLAGAAAEFRLLWFVYLPSGYLYTKILEDFNEEGRGGGGEN